MIPLVLEIGVAPGDLPGELQAILAAIEGSIDSGTVEGVVKVGTTPGPDGTTTQIGVQVITTATDVGSVQDEITQPGFISEIDGSLPGIDITNPSVTTTPTIPFQKLCCSIII